MEASWVAIYWLAPLLGWFSAHIVKWLIATIRSKKMQSWRMFFVSGGLPSSHSAVMLALATVVGVRQGFDSALFGVVITIAVLIMYDAVNLRGSVGQQGHIIQELAKKTGVNSTFHLAEGHTLTEVIAGGTLGIIVGLLMLQIL